MSKEHINPNTALIVGAGVAFVALAFYLQKKASDALTGAEHSIADAAGAVGTAVNPLDSRNVINRGVLAVGTSLTGDKNFSLGAWLYDMAHPREAGAIAAPANPAGPSEANTANFGVIDPNAAW